MVCGGCNDAVILDDHIEHSLCAVFEQRKIQNQAGVTRITPTLYSLKSFLYVAVI
jgi:hypothetical protein